MRATITNDTPNPIEYTFIGPVDAAAQVSIYLAIPNGQTGFLHLPHGRYSLVITTAGKTSQVSYNIPAGVYSCWLSKGCEAFK